MQKVFSSVQDAESSQRAFLVSGTEAYLAPYNRAINTLPGQLDTVELLISDNPAQIAQLKILRVDIDEKLVLIRLRIAQRHQLGTEALDPKYLNGAGVQKMEKVRADADGMIDGENRLLKERLRLLDAVRARSEILQLIGRLNQPRAADGGICRPGQADPSDEPRRTGVPAQQHAAPRRQQRTARLFLFRRPRPAYAAAGHQRVCAGDRRGSRRAVGPRGSPRARTHHRQRQNDGPVDR